MMPQAGAESTTDPPVRRGIPQSAPSSSSAAAPRRGRAGRAAAEFEAPSLAEQRAHRRRLRSLPADKRSVLRGVA